MSKLDKAKVHKIRERALSQRDISHNDAAWLIKRIEQLEDEFPGGDDYLYINKVCHCVSDLDKIKKLEAELKPLRELRETAWQYVNDPLRSMNELADEIRKCKEANRVKAG